MHLTKRSSTAKTGRIIYPQFKFGLPKRCLWSLSWLLGHRRWNIVHWLNRLGNYIILFSSNLNNCNYSGDQTMHWLLISHLLSHCIQFTRVSIYASIIISNWIYFLRSHLHESDKLPWLQLERKGLIIIQNLNVLGIYQKSKRIPRCAL